jgi:ABC-2 type transport system permease protein
VFYGTALIADEVDDKTITYLFVRPIQRSAVLFGKYLAYLVSAALLVLPSAMLVFFLIVPTSGGSIGAAFPSLLEDLAMLAVGLAAYGAVFALVGTRLKRPLLAGLLFALGWEPTVLLVPGYLKRLSVAYYLQALVAHEMPDTNGPGALLLRVFGDTPSVAVSLVALAVIVGGALWLAGRTVEHREYVLEQ